MLIKQSRKYVTSNVNGKYKVPCWCVKGNLIGPEDERRERSGLPEGVMRAWGRVRRSRSRCEKVK